MIPRYSRPEMAAIWSPQTRFRIWFEIEAHAADAMAKLGIVPKAAAKKIWDKGGKAEFDIARIDEIERETKHDVIAFLTHLAEIVGPEARFVHSGMTSSDVLDTCFNVQLVRAADLLLADLDALLAALEKRAPATGAIGLMDYVVRFDATLERKRTDFVVTVIVPVTTLCPCSKAISRLCHGWGRSRRRGLVQSVHCFLVPSSTFRYFTRLHAAFDHGPCLKSTITLIQ
mgnify:CR=1 FL=1